MQDKSKCFLTIFADLSKRVVSLQLGAVWAKLITILYPLSPTLQKYHDYDLNMKTDEKQKYQNV